MVEAALILVSVSVLQAGMDCSAKKVYYYYWNKWIVRCYSLFVALCDPPCLNGGECSRSDGSCTCPDGWTGPQCEQGKFISGACMIPTRLVRSHCVCVLV